MPNWKELGEVPDSDDEDFDFDSQESERSPNAGNPTEVDAEALQSTQAPENSVWDVPESSQPTPLTAPAVPEPIFSTHEGAEYPTDESPSSPLSSAQDVDELAEMFDMYSQPVAAPTVTRQAYVADHRGDSPDPLMGDDSISTGYVKITAPQFEFPIENETSRATHSGFPMASQPSSPKRSPPRGNILRGLTPSPPSSPPRTPPRDLPGSPARTSPRRSPRSAPRSLAGTQSTNPSRTQARPSGNQQHASTSRDEEVARQVAALRYERSLRPRKPIQEHPYLIENAQYSKTLKSHGLRPIRMPTEPASRQQAAEDDSQEQDFEASQGSTADAQNETTDESQAHGATQPSEFGALPVSLSSSPFRTSSPKHRGGPSSQPSLDGETDNTSMSDNGDMPSIDEIFRDSTTDQASKRRRLAGRIRSAKEVVPEPGHPSRPTFQTYDEIYGIVSSPSPDPTTAREQVVDSMPSPGIGTAFNLNTGEDYISDDDPFLSPERPVSAAVNREVVDMTLAEVSEDENMMADLGDLAAISGPESEDDAGNSEESGSEAIRNVGRRIRGVLPASWLRLDKQPNRPKPVQQTYHDRSPEKTQRRGVAVRKIGRSTSTTAATFMFEDSDDEVRQPPRTTRAASSNDDLSFLQPAMTQAIEIDDDDSSAMEDNEIDHMAPSRKRQLTLAESLQPTAKRQKKNAPTKDARLKKAGKPRKAGTRSSRASRIDPWVKSGKSTKTKPPPRLSILDVIDPDAPRFLKIAARNAQTRRNLGRTSPTNKSIRLATRRDNIDAGTVLQRWTGGKIRPRQGLQSSSTQSRPAGRRPLTQLSSNTFSRTPAASPRKRTAVQPIRSHLEDVESASPSPNARRGVRSFSRQASTSSQRAQDAVNRPAQLEMDLNEQRGRVAFHAKKRALDALFRGSHSQSLSARSVHLDSVMDDACSVISGQNVVARDSPEPPECIQARPKRPRKPRQPIRVDVAAAQFRHADDPLPTTEPFTPVAPLLTTFDDGHLSGLGPFGTQYTQHFDVFPLDRGVYFHETTLLGSGCVESATSELFSEKVWQSRPRVSFHLGEQTLRWDVWTEQVSSEFGILMDGISEQIITASETGFNTKAASRFILNYVQNSISFTDDIGAHSFITRLLEVTQAFLSRLDSDTSMDGDKHPQAIDALSSTLLVLSCAVRLCQKHAPLLSVGFTVESVLRKTAEVLVRNLLKAGLDEVTNLYENLQTLRYRERGIRADAVAPHAWVLLMKVLEGLKIPRMTFWDVSYPLLIQPAVIKGANAQEYEKLWRAMFTLLPLCEFDKMGVLIAERRHEVPMDGWALPQQVLKRVFQLYRENPRQSPSFNDYCRTLVSRCHYLVEQWGWFKCGGIIGTIFDFFGSQNLSHLRNEEAFRSARFLDNLHKDPSLKVEPEDRCFHIFLKLVALVIKKLRKKGLANDVRNLVARTLPNHDRQYSKEQNVHQNDLAALRNHHDLLCTLFWAAPPEDRPGIQLLEKLVIPASSHKEACLINLRAWSQLARFVVHAESTTSFTPLAEWQTNIFKQLLDQYNSAAGDIQQQFLAMSKDATNGISEEFMNSIVASNKAAIMEIMLFSVKLSTDVVQYASSLELARVASNSFQLREVFQHFSTLPPDFPTTILQSSLITFERLLARFETVCDESDDSQDSMGTKSFESEDAILMIDRELSSVFFSMARSILSSQAATNKLAAKSVSPACVEQCVVVSGTMSGLFIRFQMMDIGMDVLQLWLLVIVQPSQCLRFENQLGQQLQREAHPFVPEKAVGFVVNPGYLSNRGFFEYAMKWMRKNLQTTNSAAKRELSSGLSKTLDVVMNQMRADLEITAESADHPNYVRFVRSVVSLIATYGSDICAVHQFFKEVSRHYSPPEEDPQLQVAVILSYGVRLTEGDSQTASRLFYVLLNYFKKGLQLGRLPREVLLLKAAMKDDAVMAFVIRMLSAVLHATLSSVEAYALLDVFCDALWLVWNGSAMPRKLSDDTFASLSILVTSLLAWAMAVRGSSLSTEHMHVFRKVVWLVNNIQPAIESFSLESGGLNWWDELMERLGWFSLLVEGAVDYLGAELDKSEAPSLSPPALFRLLRCAGQDFRIQDATLLGWADAIVQDVERNWVIRGPMWTVPGTCRDATLSQPTHGTVGGDWDIQEVTVGLYDQLQIWNQWWKEVTKEPEERDEFDFEDYTIF
ncbi:mus7 mms22 family protein [Colletotrichum sojae]|uniref:Mus7 mms22 family protein n=1 Tax=Colletotrichum sojae TaxID=2175907 RepID=A0A8H6JYX9_9PEZI|nr:mus7 mms22 family protein [Colletotrichum sojae]